MIPAGDPVTIIIFKSILEIEIGRILIPQSQITQRYIILVMTKPEVGCHVNLPIKYLESFDQGLRRYQSGVRGIRILQDTSVSSEENMSIIILGQCIQVCLLIVNMNLIGKVIDFIFLYIININTQIVDDHKIPCPVRYKTVNGIIAQRLRLSKRHESGIVQTV